MADIRWKEKPQLVALAGTEVLAGTSIDGGAKVGGGTVAADGDVGVTTGQILAAAADAADDAIAAAIAGLAPASASVGVQFIADTSSTSDADPGAGKLRWNHGTQGSATVLFLDDLSADGVSLTALWPTLHAGGTVCLQHPGDQDIWAIAETGVTTDASGYAKVAINVLVGGGTFANGDPILVTIDRAQTTSGGVSTVNGAGGNPIIRQALAIACSDETTPLTAGTNKVKFINPYSTAFNVLAVVASLSTAQASGSIFTVDINEAGSSILSTKLTIDNTETNSSTAATAAVISDGSIAAYAEIGIDIDQIGNGTAKGLKVYLIGYPTP